MDFTERIKDKDLTKTEKIIADYILGHRVNNFMTVIIFDGELS